MKRVLVITTMLVLSLTVRSQMPIKGSLQRGPAGNQVDILFQPSYNSNPGEYVNFVNLSIALPLSSATDLVPTLTGVGIFAGMTFNPVDGGSGPGQGYTLGSERVYSWVYASGPTVMSWNSASPPFVGLRITLNGPGAAAKVKLLDLTNIAGGADQSTYFSLTTSRPNDATPYGDFFFAQADPNGSSLGVYPNTPAPGDEDFFVETNDLITLPVGLLNFSGYKSGSKNVLKWNTSSETSNLGFEVQRSTDGVNYSSIGFVNSLATGGTSVTELNYTFDDNSPVASKRNFYRLNQKDMDGKSKMSNVVLISGDKPTTIGIGGIFPNPASSTVNVLIDAPRRDDVTVVVMDALGKTLKQKVVNVEIGSNTVPVEISSLSSGSYLVKVLCKSTDCETAVSKFIKQ